MLGIRLDSGLEGDLDRFARATQRTKSDIAREAVREYLQRHSTEDEFRRQAALVHAFNAESDWDLDALFADLMRDEPDYDWGDQQP
jgi:RHH-type rel operon transcriptional repressor/antitoxin RelB